MAEGHAVGSVGAVFAGEFNVAELDDVAWFDVGAFALGLGLSGDLRVDRFAPNVVALVGFFGAAAFGIGFFEGTIGEA